MQFHFSTERRKHRWQSDDCTHNWYSDHSGEFPFNYTQTINCITNGFPFFCRSVRGLLTITRSPWPRRPQSDPSPKFKLRIETRPVRPELKRTGEQFHDFTDKRFFLRGPHFSAPLRHLEPLRKREQPTAPWPLKQVQQLWDKLSMFRVFTLGKKHNDQLEAKTRKREPEKSKQKHRKAIYHLNSSSSSSSPELKFFRSPSRLLDSDLAILTLNKLAR